MDSWESPQVLLVANDLRAVLLDTHFESCSFGLVDNLAFSSNLASSHAPYVIIKFLINHGSRQLVDEKIDQVSFKAVKEDIVRFIPDPRVLDICSPRYFHELVKETKIV